MTEEERSERIAVIIGEPKLERFLALEQNGPAYKELYALSSMFEVNRAPLTDAQLDGMLNILLEMKDQYLGAPAWDSRETSPGH